jgi:hypothetical protein
MNVLIIIVYNLYKIIFFDITFSTPFPIFLTSLSYVVNQHKDNTKVGPPMRDDSFTLR